MSNPAIEYLNQVRSSGLQEETLAEFINRCTILTAKASQREAIEYLLRVFEMPHHAIEELVKSDLVRYSIDLQYVLRKYVSAKFYRDAEKESNKKSAWVLALELLAGFPPI